MNYSQLNVQGVTWSKRANNNLTIRNDLLKTAIVEFIL